MAEEGSFTGADIMAMEEPVAQRISKTFTIKGKQYKFTIEKTDSAERFYSFLANFNEAINGAKIEGCSIPMPTGNMTTNAEGIPVPEVVNIVLKPGLYLGTLRNMANCLVEPKLSFPELAIFGHKAGKAMNGVVAWFNTEMGSSVDLQDEMDESKNGSSAADLT